MPAAPILAAVAVMEIAIICPMLGLIPFIWAMKSAATASYRAVPSMLMVAPMGRTNLAILGSTPFFSSRALIVTGRVAELDAVPNAVAKGFPMLAINLNYTFTHRSLGIITDIILT